MKRTIRLFVMLGPLAGALLPVEDGATAASGGSVGGQHVAPPLTDVSPLAVAEGFVAWVIGLGLLVLVARLLAGHGGRRQAARMEKRPDV